MSWFEEYPVRSSIQNTTVLEDAQGGEGPNCDASCNKQITWETVTKQRVLVVILYLYYVLSETESALKEAVNQRLARDIWNV